MEKSGRENFYVRVLSRIERFASVSWKKRAVSQGKMKASSSRSVSLLTTVYLII